MSNATTKLLNKIVKEYTGYWRVDDVLRYTAQVFPLHEPTERVRNALKAVACKKDKDERFRTGQRALEQASDARSGLRDVEFLMDRLESRYRKRSRESDSRDMQEMKMMMMPSLMGQKGNVSVNLDINALMESVYKECETCPIRDVCKEAFMVCSEYIGVALRELDVDLPAEDEG